MNTHYILIPILLLQTVLSTSTPVQLVGEVEQQNDFKCVRVKDCDIYNWLMDDGNYGIIGFNKRQVDVLLKKDECGLTEQGKVEKGKKYPIFSADSSLTIVIPSTEFNFQHFSKMLYGGIELR